MEQEYKDKYISCCYTCGCQNTKTRTIVLCHGKLKIIGTIQLQRKTEEEISKVKDGIKDPITPNEDKIL